MSRAGSNWHEAPWQPNKSLSSSVSRQQSHTLCYKGMHLSWFTKCPCENWSEWHIHCREREQSWVDLCEKTDLVSEFLWNKGLWFGMRQEKRVVAALFVRWISTNENNKHLLWNQTHQNNETNMVTLSTIFPSIFRTFCVATQHRATTTTGDRCSRAKTWSDYMAENTVSLHGDSHSRLTAAAAAAANKLCFHRNSCKWSFLLARGVAEMEGLKFPRKLTMLSGNQILSTKFTASDWKPDQ